MKTSLLLVSRNEEENARRFVDSFNRQTLKPSEIVLVDSSTDKTKRILSSIATKIITTEPRGCSYARAEGMKYVSGDIIVWTDIDVEMKNDWFENIIHMFDNNHVNVVQGSVKVNGFNTKEKGMFVKPPKNGKYINGCNVAFRKIVLDRYPVDPNMLWEDIELDYRISKHYPVYGCPKAVVWHYGLSGKRKYDLKHNAIWSGIAWARILKKYKNLYWFFRISYNIFNIAKVYGLKAFSYYSFYFIVSLIKEPKLSKGRKII